MYLTSFCSPFSALSVFTNRHCRHSQPMQTTSKMKKTKKGVEEKKRNRKLDTILSCPSAWCLSMRTHRGASFSFSHKQATSCDKKFIIIIIINRIDRLNISVHFSSVFYSTWRIIMDFLLLFPFILRFVVGIQHWPYIPWMNYIIAGGAWQRVRDKRFLRRIFCFHFGCIRWNYMAVNFSYSVQHENSVGNWRSHQSVVTIFFFSHLIPFPQMHSLYHFSIRLAAYLHASGLKYNK